MAPHHHRYPHGVHLSALNERNSRRVWSDDASDAGEAAITNKNCSFFMVIPQAQVTWRDNWRTFFMFSNIKTGLLFGRRITIFKIWFSITF